MCGTPIGNLEDISLRAIRTLGEADLLACEDPGRTRKLLTHLGVRAPEMLVYNEGNEAGRAGELVARVVGGETVVVVSSSGMPAVSDPGYRVVAACLDAGLDVEVVPGPTAAMAALTVSGLPPGRFCFEGFLPRKPAERRRRIADLAAEPRTLVFYESARRIESSMADLLAGLGDRRATLARELTKMFEETRRGTLSHLLEGVRSTPPRGALVVVVEGHGETPTQAVAAEELAARARALMDDGVDRGEAMRRVASEAGVTRRVVFDALVEDGARS
ncbi:MAG: 16S rRNA (cytidine(1402)-2'-O)-methyltransferase [Actinobacteria bacterium]|nr:16S rRNA (cytidine(1402)-2'-O)-methyltransferase [Actinomycetota bacterium]